MIWRNGWLTIALAIGWGWVGVGCWGEEAKQVSKPTSDPIPVKSSDINGYPLYPVKKYEWAARPHGGTKEAFDKVIAEVKSVPFEVDPRDKELLGKCNNILTAIRDGKSEYVAPKFATDDYFDQKLEPYRKKYHDYIVAMNPDYMPSSGMDMFGGLYSTTGTPEFVAPTQNFSLYELDLDGDGNKQIIFYGEALIVAAFILPKLIDESPFSAHYSFYNNSIEDIGGEGTFNPYEARKKIETNAYSTILKINNRYFMADTSGADKSISEYLRIQSLKLINGRVVDFACPFEFKNQN